MQRRRLGAAVACSLLFACSGGRAKFDPHTSEVADGGSNSRTDDGETSDDETGSDGTGDDGSAKGERGIGTMPTFTASGSASSSVVPSDTASIPPATSSQAPQGTAPDPETDSVDPGSDASDASVSDESMAPSEEGSSDQDDVEPASDTLDPGSDASDPSVSDTGDEPLDTSEGGTGGQPETPDDSPTQLGIGEPCTEDDECSVGTCQESVEGGSICCSANCGDCKQCAASGSSCTDLLETRPGCECTADDTSNCVDGIACTDDECVNGQCENPVSAGSCLIAGQCLTEGTSQQGNTCFVCDSQQPTGWSAASAQVSCDDGLWCNGSDFCNGSGACGHEYPNGNRCTTTGPCALSACNEQSDTCFEAEGIECSSETELRCQDTSCGGDVEVRTNVGYCDGLSPSCGPEEQGTWAIQTNCITSQKCDPQTFTCVDTLGCGSTWCDTQQGLCWTTSLPPDGRTLAEATTYCADLVLAGRSDWRLPTSNELASIARGCDGTDGSLESVDFRSTCRTTPDDLGYDDCTACLTNGGPTSGCYWPTELGNCPSNSGANFWSSTAMPSLPGVYYYFQFRASNFGAGGDTTELQVRCVTTD